jgi:sulfatase maturation enzyme AslB (radical SAM superfamily)
LIERISIELTNRCAKACWFCYNRSGPGGAMEWSPSEVVGFVRDCAHHGVRDVSFGGGEPLEYPHLLDVLHELRGLLHRSITTNGLLLDTPWITALAQTGLEKVHVSIHFPERDEEVTRVIEQVRELESAGIRSGVNLLVGRQNREAARKALEQIHTAGIGPERVILLPMRLHGAPTPEDVAWVAGGQPFQATSCLTRCSPSPRFVSIDCNKEVGWCSYTQERRRLAELTWRALCNALAGLGLKSCWSQSHE